MKKILLLIALMTGIGVSAQAQIDYINAPWGKISVGCSEYTNNVHRQWIVDIGKPAEVRIDYDLNLEQNDNITFYRFDPGGVAHPWDWVSGTASGTIYIPGSINNRVYIE